MVQVVINQILLYHLQLCEKTAAIGSIFRYNVEKICRQNTRCGEIFCNFVKI